MNERKKYILISAAAVVGLLVITFIPMMLGSDNEKSTPEPASTPGRIVITTTINGFAERAENLSDSRIELIEENLFETLKMNNSGSNITDDAMIREGTYQQTLQNPAKQIYFTTFIVDISSLKQSYRINDYYSSFPPEVSGLRDYATLVLCLDVKDLIYGEFDCMDRIKAEQRS